MIKKYQSYLKENYSQDTIVIDGVTYNSGDRIIYKSHFVGKQSGTFIGRNEFDIVVIEFDKNWGNFSNNRYYTTKENLSGKLEKGSGRIFTLEDPYGEEIWESVDQIMTGDYIKCIRDKNMFGGDMNLTLNKIYRARRVVPSKFGTTVNLINDTGRDSTVYSIDSFRKCTKKELEMVNKHIDIDPYGEEDWILERKISYQKKLSKDLWDGDVLNERIEEKLVKIANDFFEDVELNTEIIDINLTGSMANYNYTSESDIDVHIVIDFKDISDDTELVKKAVDGQRFMWNLRHNITIKGHDVELYIQDKSEEYTATGLYSLLNKEWMKHPKYSPPNVDTEDIEVKYDARLYDILKMEKISKQDLHPGEAEEYYESAKELKTKIMKARKEGLRSEGEFSIENLVFKKLRREGKIKKLIDIISRFYDKIYSQ